MALCVWTTASAPADWGGALVEAFARTGEELFFRGFLFVLFLQLFANRRWPWLWAVVITSILFTLVHTQTFQPAYWSANGYPAASAAFIITERLLNLLLFAALPIALLRAWTRSILPGAIAHGLLNGGLLTLPFVLLIYFGITLWARLRGEQISFGIKAQPDLSNPSAP